MAVDHRPLGEEEFYAAISEYFELASPCTRDSHLGNDMGLDSIAVFELLMFCEDLAGHTLAVEAEASFDTIGSVYDFYLQMRSA